MFPFCFLCIVSQTFIAQRECLPCILPAQIFPVADRGTGAGVAAAFGKAGAVLGVLFMPILMKWGGVTLALAVTAALLVVGAVITKALGQKLLPEQ